MNPYAAPGATPDAPSPGESPEQERLAHLTAEGAILYVGLQNYLAATWFVAMAAFRWANHDASTGYGREEAFVRFLAAVLGSGAVAFLGRRVRTFGPVARVLETLYLLCGALMSCGFAIPWVVIALWALWSQRASVVFSDRYQGVTVPATPHLKSRAELLWIPLVLMGVFAFMPAMNFIVFGAPTVD